MRLMSLGKRAMANRYLIACKDENQNYGKKEKKTGGYEKTPNKNAHGYCSIESLMNNQSE